MPFSPSFYLIAQCLSLLRDFGGCCGVEKTVEEGERGQFISVGLAIS